MIYQSKATLPQKQKPDVSVAAEAKRTCPPWRKLHIAFYLVVMALMFSACYLKPGEIEGTYFHNQLGKRYSLTMSKGEFRQVLLSGDQTFTNSGEYTLSDVVILHNWKEMAEILDTTKGGCYGCELKFRGGKLLYYTDPDGGPAEVFIKQ